MEIENHKEEVPFAHYEVLFRALNPQEVLSRLPDTQWDGTEFTLRLLGREFAIAHPGYAIRALDGGVVPPLPTQTFLLRYLLENKEKVISRESLLDHVWGFDFVGETNAVDVYIRFLRAKIDERFGVKLIHTVRGVGYVIREE